MTRTHLVVPTLHRFFLIFDKIHKNIGTTNNLECSLNKESNYIEVCRDGTTNEWSVGGKPVKIAHVRLKNTESSSLSPPVTQLSHDSNMAAGQDELRAVFCAELAYLAYVPFLRLVGEHFLEASLGNIDTVKELCQEYVRQSDGNLPKIHRSDFDSGAVAPSGSIGSNVALVGNRIDVQVRH